MKKITHKLLVKIFLNILTVQEKRLYWPSLSLHQPKKLIKVVLKTWVEFIRNVYSTLNFKYPI